MNVITSKRSNRPLKTHISVLEFALHLLLVLSFWETVVGFTPSTTGTFRVPTLLPVAYVSSHSTVGGYTNGVPENSSQRLSVRSPVWTNAQSRFSSEKLAVARFQPTLAQATKNIFSATLYASTALATSGLIRSVMKTILSLVPTWLRVFFQPFLVLYYVPLFVLRVLVGPTRERAREEHVAFMEKWKQTIGEAEQMENISSPMYS